MQSTQAIQQATTAGLRNAVHRNHMFSMEGLLERGFTFAFRGLVYPQIWEDPVIDMEALALRPDDRIITIASGGCNALSYLTGNPEQIIAVDLNGAHVALTKLKIEAARRLPDHAAFYRLFGEANSAENIVAFDRLIAPHLDAGARAWWTHRTLTGGRRVDMFAGGFYRHGLLGRFIGAGHMLAKLLGVDPTIMLTARNPDEQRALFDRHIAPLFSHPVMRWLIRRPASLYGLGIPPAQYRALAEDHHEGIGTALRMRLEKLACGFDLRSNYFAWQAFGRGYAPGPSPSTPPYLEAGSFDMLRERAGRVNVVHASMTDELRLKPAASLDCYVLLDAQDWMDDRTLTELWTEITRTARPGARVIFRTAADERLLPGRIPDHILRAWTFESERSRDYGDRDRSAIYGAFHLYTLQGATT